MNKREAARLLRKSLTTAIRSLPDDVEYKAVSFFEDMTTQNERDHETRQGMGVPDEEGALHVIELTVKECRKERKIS